MTEPKTNVTVSDVLQDANDVFKRPESDWYWDEAKRLCDLEGGGFVSVDVAGDGVWLCAPQAGGAIARVHIPTSLLAVLGVHWLDIAGLKFSAGRVADAKEGAPDASGTVG